jgi:hypothetical protein
MDTLQWVKEFAPIVEAVAVAIGVGWGLKLAKQVVQTKDATIDLLREERDRYKALALPAVAAEHKAAMEFAERVSAQKQQLEQSVKPLKEAMAKGQAETEQQRNLGVGIGCMEGAAGLELLVGDYLKPSQTATGPFDFIAAIGNLRDKLLKQAQEAVEGRRPALSNLHRISAQKPPAR